MHTLIIIFGEASDWAMIGERNLVIVETGISVETSSLDRAQLIVEDTFQSVVITPQNNLYDSSQPEITRGIGGCVMCRARSVSHQF